MSQSRIVRIENLERAAGGQTRFIWDDGMTAEQRQQAIDCRIAEGTAMPDDRFIFLGWKDHAAPQSA